MPKSVSLIDWFCFVYFWNLDDKNSPHEIKVIYKEQYKGVEIVHCFINDWLAMYEWFAIWTNIDITS